MVTNDVQDELAEGFEVAPMPPIGKDGSLELPPMREASRPHPRLCEAGPCRNYHRFDIQMDAAKPRGEKQPDGSVVTPPARFHVETHHYCYPNVGIESRLGSLPVIQCNRWDPISAEEQQQRDKSLDVWLASEPGVAFQAELAGWREDRDREDRELDEAAAQAAADLALMPTEATEASGCVLEVGLENLSIIYCRAGGSPAGAWPWATTVREIVLAAIASQEWNIAIDECQILLRRAASTAAPHPLVLEHTIGHAGLSQGDRLLVSKKSTDHTGPVSPVDLGGEG